ncbi:MAG: hypothetical protein KDD70_02720 [Bdellovibrionales bacterium]|nr:hypothetical protein [Bdellovibrionales bacterium]
MDVAPIFRFSLAEANRRGSGNIQPVSSSFEVDTSRAYSNDRERKNTSQESAFKNDDAVVVSFGSRTATDFSSIAAANGYNFGDDAKEKEREDSQERKEIPLLGKATSATKESKAILSASNPSPEKYYNNSSKFARYLQDKPITEASIFIAA